MNDTTLGSPVKQSEKELLLFWLLPSLEIVRLIKKVSEMTVNVSLKLNIKVTNLRQASILL